MFEEQSGERLDPIDLSIALIALKARHHLSNNCIADILTLLRLLGIHAPSSCKAVCTLLKKRSTTHLTPSTQTICPHCQKVSSQMRKCTACAADYSPILPWNIPEFYTYNISCQLETVLATTKDLCLHTIGHTRNAMRDITDGEVYRNLLANESGRFITLTMNVDGIQPNKGSDQSLWPILFVINEIDRKKTIFATEPDNWGDVAGAHRNHRASKCLCCSSMLFRNYENWKKDIASNSTHLITVTTSKPSKYFWSKPAATNQIKPCCNAYRNPQRFSVVDIASWRVSQIPHFNAKKLCPFVLVRIFTLFLSGLSN